MSCLRFLITTQVFPRALFTIYFPLEYKLHEILNLSLIFTLPRGGWEAINNRMLSKYLPSECPIPDNQYVVLTVHYSN